MGAVAADPAAPAAGRAAVAGDAGAAGRAPCLTRWLLDQAGLKAGQADSGAVTLTQRFGSAANLNIHLHCLVLDGVYQRTDAEPIFVEVPAPTDEALRALLHKIIARLMKLLARRDVLVEEQGVMAARRRGRR